MVGSINSQSILGSSGNMENYGVQGGPAMPQLISNAPNCCRELPQPANQSLGGLQQVICEIIQLLTQALVGLIQQFIAKFTGQPQARGAGNAREETGGSTASSAEPSMFEQIIDTVGSLFSGGKKVVKAAGSIFSAGKSLFKKIGGLF